VKVGAAAAAADDADVSKTPATDVSPATATDPISADFLLTAPVPEPGGALGALAFAGLALPHRRPRR
jgi:hypothetical protein